jgi:putative ABC transport system ATP-binding protein
LIEAVDVTKTYIMGKTKLQALKGINLSIEKGEYVALMGPSGSGKSTLLHQLGILDKPTTGDVILDKVRTGGLSDQKKIDYRLRNLGYVFQDYALLPELTALENVYLPLLMQGASRKKCAEEGGKILEEVGLAGWTDHLPSELSGGQQQRVSIARALVHKPKILYADEPCANLDSESSKHVLDLFKKFNREYGQTIIMVTHEEWHLTHTKFDRVIRLKDGLVEKTTK